MGTAEYDVVVVGLGALGSAAAYHLASRGARVLGLEQFAPGHTRGSSHGETRIIRLAYFEHPDYVALLHRAYELWEGLQDRAGVELLRLTGGLFIGPEDGEVFAGSLRSAREHHLDHGVLDAGAIRQRLPMFKVGGGDSGLYEARAGVLFPERCIGAYLRLAREAGATFHYDTPVQAIEPQADGSVVVRTQAAQFHAGRVVVTTGAWLGRLLADLRLPLAPERNVVFWVQPPTVPERFQAGAFPIFIWETPDGSFYGLPQVSERGVKVAQHHTGDFVDPNHVNREVMPADEAPVRRFLRERIPSLDAPVKDSSVCLYTNTPDGHFVVDRHPEHPSIVFAGGCSGHGFKFASVLGEALADLALKGETALPIEFLRAGRLRG